MFDFESVEVKNRWDVFEAVEFLVVSKLESSENVDIGEACWVAVRISGDRSLVHLDFYIAREQVEEAEVVSVFDPFVNEVGPVMSIIIKPFNPIPRLS